MGLTFTQILSWWGLSFSLSVFVYTAVTGPLPTYCDDAISAVMATFLGGILAFFILAVKPSKTVRRRAMVALWISFANMCAIQIGHLSIGLSLFLTLLDRNGLAGSLLLQFTLETASLLFCFYLPDVDRLRFILQRSLAPTAMKIPLLVDSSLITDYPLLTATPPSPDDSEPLLESGRELSVASSSLFSFGLCVRMVCCTASRASLLLVADFNVFALTAAVGLSCQWTLAAMLLSSVVKRPGTRPAIVPLLSFEKLIGLTGRCTKASELQATRRPSSQRPPRHS
ncbi:hypothetical protein DFJ73DRAFT_254701 [Zopfochytrium polystomum]|nr:hypothetical protein DFJ73DRAFT_254701 [Zopfochytrium polystomum]